ncbi:uncharacterized protein LOC129778100 [Toxorhynchites rutilus septentrionalis]|uniref:uncharacterized protein LOC129778100 n=1 Tax=Toxorhynchites rutilus septentrionalis TaxID=329112 RepID=UPI00247A46CE|nr:uncharacterized protein LOC129778100 [Toxorhynchites rutilus septentrionalis]
MEQFWTIGEGTPSSCYSVEETARENHFLHTVTPNPNGRHIVRVSLKDNVLEQLGDNCSNAVRRDTTKLRVVFDASAKTPNGASLNDALMVDPIVQDLRSITMRSRRKKETLIADIRQMLHHLLVDPRNKPLQCIVLHSTPDTPLHIFKHRTVTASAHFLATRVLQQPSEGEQSSFLMSAEVLRMDFSVDEPKSMEEAIELREPLNRVYSNKQTTNTKTPTSEITRLTRGESRNMEAVLIKLVQQQKFLDEWTRLQQLQPVKSKFRLQWFAPFMSLDQLFRIGVRLTHAPQPYNIRSLHLKNLHAAQQLLLTLPRLWYWITGARSLTKNVVHQCIFCFKIRLKLVAQFMGELPAAGVTASRPSSATAVDYWGPTALRPPYRRAASSKAYIAVFVCFSTRAVHIELVTDLSTAKLIQALRRSVSHQSLCAVVYSVNGRNFLVADNEIQRLVRNQQHRQTVAQECATNGMQPLTPEYFSFGSALKAVPDSDVFEILFNRLTQWQQIQELLQNIWKKWHSGYLSTLQSSTVTISNSQLVLLNVGNCPPMIWPTANRRNTPRHR